jgi:S-adenosylmethionine:tRNA ribosyltransferase-isomerase
MHSEVYSLNEQVTNAINSHKKASKHNKILTVGTTSTRVLESCANLIDKSNTQTDDSNSHANGKNTSKFELLSGTGETNIFIYPPYQFKIVDALLTNFHMPGLTPIM